MQITYRFRVKDKHAVRLLTQAAAVDFVWNFCNEMQTKAVKSGREWLNYNGLHKFQPRGHWLRARDWALRPDRYRGKPGR